MTRKDYVALARALRLARIDTAMSFIANELQADNLRFKRDEFVKAILKGN